MPLRQDNDAHAALGPASEEGARSLVKLLTLVLFLGSTACSHNQSTSQGAVAPSATRVEATVVRPAPSPVQTAAPAPPAQPPTALPDRTDCNAIRGTEYRSASERTWFIANCSPTAVPAARPAASAPAPLTNLPPAGPASATCGPTEITSSSNFEREYYDVTGTTLDQLNASVLAYGLTADDGTKAVGRTKYTIRRTGTRCARGDACQIGSMHVEVTGTITLPRVPDPSGLGPETLASWNSYVQDVSLHEDRHATIATEGTDEMKRQLLEVGTMPCAAFDSTLERIWRLETEAIDRRQAAFHVADRQGAGGLVVR